MTPRRLHLALFGVCVGLLPVPFLVLSLGLEPVLRIAFIGSLAASVFVFDPDYISGLISGALLAQALVWGLVLYFATRLAARRLPSSLLATLIALLAVASLFPIYTTPFSSSGGSSSVFGIFD